MPSEKIIIDKCKINNGKNKQEIVICGSKPENKYQTYTNNTKINWNRNFIKPKIILAIGGANLQKYTFL